MLEQYGAEADDTLSMYSTNTQTAAHPPPSLGGRSASLSSALEELSMGADGNGRNGHGHADEGEEEAYGHNVEHACK